MILFWRETQDGSFSAQDLRPAGAAAGVHAAAPLHAGAGPGGVRLAERGARRHAGPGAVRAGHAGNITAYVRNDLCIGAWQGSRLGGYLIVRFCGRSAHNYAAFMDVPRTEWEHWANADSAIVHADFRGNGLQRLMLEAALPLFPKKITHIGATVSPQNQYSLHNALASGFAIVSRREMYGGHDRYLLAKEL